VNSSTISQALSCSIGGIPGILRASDNRRPPVPAQKNQEKNVKKIRVQKQTTISFQKQSTVHCQQKNLRSCGLVEKKFTLSTSLSLSEDSTKDGTRSQSAEGRSGSADAVRWKMEPATHWYPSSTAGTRRTLIC